MFYNIDKIEQSISNFEGDVTVLLALEAETDVPDGFIEQGNIVENGQTRYEKVVDAKDGKPTKKIILFIPE